MENAQNNDDDFYDDETHFSEKPVRFWHEEDVDDAWDGELSVYASARDGMYELADTIQRACIDGDIGEPSRVYVDNPSDRLFAALRVHMGIEEAASEIETIRRFRISEPDGLGGQSRAFRCLLNEQIAHYLKTIFGEDDGRIWVGPEDLTIYVRCEKLNRA